MPNLSDPEGNIVTISSVVGNPSYMTLQTDSKTFSILAPLATASVSYNITIIFTDGVNSVSSNFTIYIVN